MHCNSGGHWPDIDREDGAYKYLGAMNDKLVQYSAHIQFIKKETNQCICVWPAAFHPGLPKIYIINILQTVVVERQNNLEGDFHMGTNNFY